MSKYFNSIHGWRIEKEDSIGNDTIPSPDEAPGFEVKSDDDKEVEDDLPF